MPVEIKELHIRVTVSDQPPADAHAARGGQGGEGADREAIVAECVEQVFQLLQASRER
jgi:Family of unknown function (DUF5908)